ncbi:MAG: tRNA-dihydrouridine synthase [Candidatus Daviesbacteria bacterium]|nr:tRNA-dihydrouridine synthase [Candidatus Daviesbacteria bacterium]
MKNFWQKLHKPFFVLAPMEDVTDTAFRQVITKVGKPDVFFTEFLNVDGLFSKGKDRVAPRLKFSKIEHPIVAQIWGTDLDNFTKAAKLINKMGFDGIDINMGCPQKSVIKQKTCSALINDPKKAEEIFKAVKSGSGSLPVSIKTRIGFSEIITEEWLGFLLKLKPDALIVHGRTVKELSKVPTHWEEIGKVVKMRDEMGSKTLIVGNGDIESYQDGLKRAQQYKVDGIMIGRGIFQNPWIFNPKVDILKITPEQRKQLLLDHVKIFEKTWANQKDFNIMKKFFKAYIRDYPGALEQRAKLMEAKNIKEINITSQF